MDDGGRVVLTATKNIKNEIFSRMFYFSKMGRNVRIKYSKLASGPQIEPQFHCSTGHFPYTATIFSKTNIHVL